MSFILFDSHALESRSGLYLAIVNHEREYFKANPNHSPAQMRQAFTKRYGVKIYRDQVSAARQVHRGKLELHDNGFEPVDRSGYLTPRQQEVLNVIAKYFDSGQQPSLLHVAESMGVSVATVVKHRRNLQKKRCLKAGRRIRMTDKGREHAGPIDIELVLVVQRNPVQQPGTWTAEELEDFEIPSSFERAERARSIRNNWATA